MGLVMCLMRRALRRAWRSVLLVIAVSSGMALYGSGSAALVDGAEEVLGETRLGGYDILVRPVGSRTALEESEGLVAPDHLSGISGGIPFSAYEAIRDLPGVEVAAPIAILGYQRLHFWVGALLPAEGTYEVRCVREVDDGVRQHAEESAATFTISRQDLAALGQTDPMTSEPLFAPRAGCLFGYWGLVVAIDPAAEDALVGLRGAIRGKYLPDHRETPTDVSPPQGEAWTGPAVPVLLLLPDQPLVSLYGEAMRLHVRNEGSEPALIPIGGGSNLVDRLYAAQALEWSDAWLPSLRPRYARVETPTGTSADTALEAVLPRPWPSFPWEVPVALNVGTRTGPSLSTEDLGTLWRPVDVVEAGVVPTASTGVATLVEGCTSTSGDHLAGGAVLPKTIDMAGSADVLPHLSPPVTMLTTLGVARALGGEDAISAVRVRVAGIERLSRQALARIDTVAAEIAKRTGLEVDVAAGSATREVLVHLPDVGYVEQTWIQRGVGQALLAEAEQTAAGLGRPVGVLVAGLLLGAAWGPGQRGTSDYAVLARLGWPRRAVIALALSVGLLVGVLGAGVGLLAATAVAMHLGWEPVLVPGLGLLPVGGLAGAVGQVRAVPAAQGEPHGRSEARHTRWLPTLGVPALYGAMVSLAFGVVRPLQALCAETPLGEEVASQVAPLVHLALGLAAGLAIVGVAEALAREAASRCVQPALLVRLGWRRTRALCGLGRTGAQMLMAGAAGGLAGTLLAGLLCGVTDWRLALAGAGAVTGGIVLAFLGEWVGLGRATERATLPDAEDGGGGP